MHETDNAHETIMREFLADLAKAVDSISVEEYALTSARANDAVPDSLPEVLVGSRHQLTTVPVETLVNLMVATYLVSRYAAQVYQDLHLIRFLTLQVIVFLQQLMRAYPRDELIAAVAASIVARAPSPSGEGALLSVRDLLTAPAFGLTQAELDGLFRDLPAA